MNKKSISLALALTLTASGFSCGIPVLQPASVQAAKAVEPPQQVRVPTLAYDDKNITLVWDKPEYYDNIKDYNVYMNGVKIGSANENAILNSPSKKYIDKFYKDYDKDNNYVKASFHNFTATDLKPDTSYTFTVTAVDVNDQESAMSNSVTQATTATPVVFNIVDYGAKNDGVTLNTDAIQATIDAATPGSKVLIPEGVFKTGAIWLKSDMTLEVAEGAVLLGSEKAEDYPFNYYHYDYLTVPRYYSLINAQTFDHGTLKNIRIVGKGVIDGNGWARTLGEYKDEPAEGYADTDFPKQVGSSSSNYSTYGILAKNQTQYRIDQGASASDAYSTRSNLIMMKGVENVYYGGFTALNPANHTLVNSESNNVTVNGVKLLTYDDNNADGIEFIHGDGLTVFNTVFDTGDDGMNFAAGQGAIGQKNPTTQNAWIFNNYFREGHGAIVAGSHTAAWIQNILAEDNVMFHTDVGLRCKTTSTHGGGAKNIVFRDNAMKDISTNVFIFTSGYSDKNAVSGFEPAAAPAQFRDITVKNVTVDGFANKNQPVISVAGLDNDGEHQNIRFDNVKFWNISATKQFATISFMKNSTFKDVIVNGTLSKPWGITDSTGLTFEGSTITSTGANSSADAAEAPVWPENSALSVTVTSDTYADLSWIAATDTVGVKSYKVIDTDSNTVVASGITKTSTRVSELSPAMTYHFKVEAADASGNWTTTGPSAIATTTGKPDITPPTFPDNTEFTKITTDGIPNTTWYNIKWSVATDTYGIKQYNVYKNGQLEGYVSGKVNTMNIGGLAFATEYTFEVEAVDGAGNKTKYSKPLKVTTAAAYDVEAPKWPEKAAITASDITKTSVTLHWPNAADDLGVAGYRVYQNGKPLENQVKFTPVNDAKTTNETSYTVTGLEPDTTYTFKVEAGDVASKWTGSGPSITVATGDSKTPVWPEGSAVKGSNIGKTSLTLNWPAATDNVAVTGYKVFNGSTEIASLSAETLSYTVNNLSSSTSYTFSVKATDAAGNWTVDGLKATISTQDKSDRDSSGGSSGGNSSSGSSPATTPNTPAATPAPSTKPETTEPSKEPTATTQPSAKFSDVTDKYDWAKNAIDTLTAKGIVQGSSDTTFDPDKKITRSDFVTLLVRALDLKAEFTNNFSDVNKNDYYYEALGIAKELGITTGVDGSRFDPRAEISRQDMMVLCARAMKLANKLTANGNAADLAGFSDKSQVASYAAESIAAMVKEGIVEGNGSGLNPMGNASRAETAVIIYRIFNKK